MNTQKLTAANEMELQKTQVSVIGKWFQQQAEGFERNRIGLMAILITLQSCIGSIACMYTLEKDAVGMLMACAALTMGCNSVLIAQAKAKVCLIALYVSILANTVFIVLNV